MSDILRREEFLATLSEYCGLGRDFPESVTQNPLSLSDAALRAVIQQAVEDVEKMDHGEMCQSNADWRNPPPCNCGHDAAIAKLKKGLGGK